MNKHFERLEKISNDYRATVDALGPEYEADAARDSRYSDEIRVQRTAERSARFNAEIDRAAQRAAEDAAPLISELRKALKKYVTTSTDPATLATLQSLIAGGVELTDSEVAAFADGADYPTLRLLERLGKGRIQAPKVSALEADLKELEIHFRDLRCYRAGMAAISTERPWGLAPTVGNTIEKGKLDYFADKLAEISNRWACALGGDA